ncbi:MAG: hypothetical protein NDI80_06310, partial [Flavobacteriaceae bacterium]|nr:hypothetical protein [Flavobacteriaceae bacterium]
MKNIFAIILLISVMFLSCKGQKNTQSTSGYDGKSGATKIVNTLHYPQEKHLKNIKQLTFGGDNAEAYWSFDNQSIVFQATNKAWGDQCDQIYTMPISQDLSKGGKPQLISTGLGRTTCSYFLPGNKTIVYSSTHLGGNQCPPVPNKEDYGGKYVWPVYDSFDIFTA